MTISENFFLRTKNILDPNIALKESFVIVGVGSGGSRLAEEAVRLGVGRVILIDKPDELLEEHNITRHILGYSSLGEKKVLAVQKRLLDIKPNCLVDVYEIDVVKNKQQLYDIFDSATQIHLCTDNQASRFVVNEVAIKLQKNLVFASVFDGGIGGEVGITCPGRACYGCISEYINRAIEDPTKVENIDYSSPNVEGFKSTSALNIDISQIALIQARVAYLLMINKQWNNEWNYILFGNRIVPGLFPRILHNEFWNIEINKNCFVCNNDLLYTDSKIEQKANEFIAAASIKGV